MILTPQRSNSFRNPQNGEANKTEESRLLKAISGPDHSLVSFDIFDTVLTRNVGEPTALFYEVGAEILRRGLVGCSLIVFVQVRYANEQRARTNKNGGEVSLREIYQEVAQVLYCLDKIDELVAIELQVERKSLRAMPHAKEAVNYARQRFGKAIFISDMYLPKWFVEEQLEREGLWQPEDQIYLSSDIGVQKGDGRLFQHVLQAESIDAKQLLHCGDSVRYDITPARKLGIKTFHWDLGNPRPSESALNKHSSWNEGFGSGLAGAARMSRLTSPETEPDKRAMWNVGATVTGPLVLVYAQWILDRAAQLGITQLFFLARDAYFPYLAVKSMLSKIPESPITVRYNYGSRATYLALGVTDKLGIEEWEGLTVHGGEPCRRIKDLAAALMAKEETIREHINPLGFSDEDWNRELPPIEIERIREHALGNAEFNRQLLCDLQDFRQLTKRYFQQEGLDPTKGIALIDTGWTSRSHAPLYRFLRELGCDHLKLFYIGLMVDEPFLPIDSIEPFVFDVARRRGAIPYDIQYARACEALLFADHGRTIGLRDDGGEIIPVMDAVENPDAVERYFPSYSGGIHSFFANALAHHEAGLPRLGMSSLAEQVITRFWQKPTIDEAEIWSRMNWQWDPQGRVTYPFCRKYKIGDVWQAWKQKGRPQCYPQFWVEGSTAISDRRILFLLRAVGRISRDSREATKRLPAPVVSLIRRAMTRLKILASYTGSTANLCVIGESMPYV